MAVVLILPQIAKILPFFSYCPLFPQYVHEKPKNILYVVG